MSRSILCSLALVLLALSAPVLAEEAAPRVRLETSLGTIEIELFPDKAPLSVENFLAYVDAGFYEGTVFHRVIPSFMIQGGGFTADLLKKPTRDPIRNEADNGLRNERYTIAMARTSDPHSATSQFYINTTDNSALDHRATNPRDWGYAVFGRVVAGREVVDQIEKVATTRVGGMSDVPREPVVIRKAVRLEGEQQAEGQE